MAGGQRRMADFSLVPSGHGSNYTGMLTRSIVFSGALLVFLAGALIAKAISALANGGSVWHDNCLDHCSELDCIRWDHCESICQAKGTQLTAQNHGTSIHYSYGLHRRCSNTNLPPANVSLAVTSNYHCTQFPRYEDCRGDDRYFCSMWRSVGFLMSFAVVLEGMTLAAFAVLLVGGKQKREQGWGVLTILVALAALVQAIGMALMVGLDEATGTSRV